MKILPFGKKEWILSQNEDSTINQLCINRTGNKISIEDFKVLSSPSEISCKKAHLVTYSERLLISQESFLATKPEILKLQVDEKIRLIGPWPDGTRVRHALYLVSKGEQQNEYIIVSIPEKDIELIVNKFQKTIRIKSCVPHVASISSIVGQLTDDLTLSCFLTKGLLEIIVSQKGLPIYSQISPLDLLPNEDLSIISQTIYNVRQIIGSRFDKSVKKVLFFSRDSDFLPDKIQDEKIWYPDLSNFIIKGDEKLFFKYPDLLGAIFVPKQFNLLPQHLKQAYLIRDLNKISATIAITCSIALGISADYLNKQKEISIKKYNKIYEKVRKEKDELIHKLPSPKITKQVSNLFQIWNEIEKEPNITSILLNLSKAIPKKVTLAHISISRASLNKEVKNDLDLDLDQENQEGLSEPAEILSDESQDLQRSLPIKTPLTMDIILLAQGEFNSVKNQLEQTTIALNKYFNLSEVKWAYHEKDNSGILTCKINLNVKHEENEDI